MPDARRLSESPVDRGSDREATSRGLAFQVAGMPAGFPAPPVERFEPEPDQRLLARYLKWLALMREAAGAPDQRDSSSVGDPPVDPARATERIHVAAMPAVARDR